MSTVGISAGYCAETGTLVVTVRAEHGDAVINEIWGAWHAGAADGSAPIGGIAAGHAVVYVFHGVGAEVIGARIGVNGRFGDRVSSGESTVSASGDCGVSGPSVPPSAPPSTTGTTAGSVPVVGPPPIVDNPPPTATLPAVPGTTPSTTGTTMAPTITGGVTRATTGTTGTTASTLPRTGGGSIMDLSPVVAPGMGALVVLGVVMVLVGRFRAPRHS